MYSSKEAILLELGNLREALSETLRNRYLQGAASSYYAECLIRLNSLESKVTHTPAENEPQLSQFWIQVGVLSDLISRIERSHLEQYPWPFAMALEETCIEICTDPESGIKPLFFFLGDGGATSTYAVRLEDDHYNIMERTIFSVIFPRTLRNHVLLHAIFGHEMMHAAVSTRFDDFRDIIDALVVSSPLASPNDLSEWCRRNLGIQSDVSDRFLRDQMVRWHLELLCDLLGLMIMGPSYIQALHTLVGPGSCAEESEFVPSHPPYDTRISVLCFAAKSLGLLFSRVAGHPLERLTKRLDDNFEAIFDKCQPKFLIIPEKNVETAAGKLFELASGFKNLVFPIPTTELIEGLIAAIEEMVPPVGPLPPLKDSDGRALADPEHIDFRHILLAGWIRCLTLPDKERNNVDVFRDINRLCAHAIMQQRSVDIAIGLVTLEGETS